MTQPPPKLPVKENKEEKETFLSPFFSFSFLFKRFLSGNEKSGFRSTDPFTTLELKNPSHVDFELHKNHRLADREALKLGRSSVTRLRCKPSHSCRRGTMGNRLCPLVHSSGFFSYFEIRLVHMSPTSPSTILEPQNPWIDEFYVVQEHILKL